MLNGTPVQQPHQQQPPYGNLNNTFATPQLNDINSRHSYPFTHHDQQKQQQQQQQATPQYVKSYFGGPGGQGSHGLSQASNPMISQQQVYQQQQQFFSKPGYYPYTQTAAPMQSQAQQKSDLSSIYDVYSSAASQATTTPMQQSSQNVNYTPMSVSPVNSYINKTPIVPLPPSSQISTPGSALKRPLPQLDQNYPCTVTVFGFRPEASSMVLSLFRTFGDVKLYTFVGNTNWMNIEYGNEIQAQMALSKNGTIIDETMIGVVPMRASHEAARLRERESLGVMTSPFKTSSAGYDANLIRKIPSNPVVETPIPEHRKPIVQKSNEMPSAMPEISQFSDNKIDALDQTLRQVADMITQNFSSHSDEILHVLRACIEEFPNNAPLYALIYGLIASESSHVASSLIESLQLAFHDDLSNGRWQRLKNILRFVGELAYLNVITINDLISAYTMLLTVVNDAFSRQERKDVFVSTVLHALSWTGPMVDKNGKADALFTTIEGYMSQHRKDRLNASRICRVLNTDSPEFPQIDTLQLLFSQVMECRKGGWDLNQLIQRPMSDLLTAAGASSPINAYPFGPIKIPLEKPGIDYPPPFPHFEVFNAAILSSKGRIEVNLPSTYSIDRCIMYDIIEDLLYFYDANIPELLRYFDENLSFPFSSFNINQMFMEVIISQIFLLPKPNKKLVYYYSIVIQLIRQHPKVIPPILGKAFYTLFANVDQMEVECLTRFSSWFAFHISNFDFKWNWKEWVPDLNPVEDTVKSLFVKESLEKSVRLAYFERVTKAIPEGIDLMPWMPPQPEPRFKYGRNAAQVAGIDPEHVKMADKLLSSMRLKQSLEEKRAIVEEIKGIESSGMAIGEDEAGMELARDIVIQCVLLLGSKSFSHIMNSIERQMDLLMLMNQTAEGKMKIMRVVAEFWATNHLFFTIVVEKLVNYKIVDPTTVVTWIFDKDGGMKDFTRSYIWDILKKTVHKLNSRITQVTEKIKKTKEMSPVVDMETNEKPATEDEKLEDLEASLDALKREQKHLFSSIFTHFMKALSDHESFTSESWKHWTLGMMKEFGRHFHAEVKGFATTLEMTVFMNADEEFKSIFHQLKSIHS